MGCPWTCARSVPGRGAKRRRVAVRPGPRPTRFPAGQAAWIGWWMAVAASAATWIEPGGEEALVLFSPLVLLLALLGAASAKRFVDRCFRLPLGELARAPLAMVAAYLAPVPAGRVWLLVGTFAYLGLTLAGLVVAASLGGEGLGASVMQVMAAGFVVAFGLVATYMDHHPPPAEGAPWGTWLDGLGELNRRGRFPFGR